MAKQYRKYLEKQYLSLPAELIEAPLLAVSSQGELSLLAQKADALPDDVTSILELHGRQRDINALAEWWFSGVKESHKALAPYMDQWLLFAKQDPFYLEQLYQYKAFVLSYLPGIKDKQLDNYISSVRGKTLTQVFTKEGVLPGNTSSLLEVTDDALIQNLAAWWAQNGDRYSRWKPYVKAFLDWHKALGKQAGPAADQPEEQATATRQAEILCAPACGIRLLHLLQIFRKATAMTSAAANETFIRILTNDRFYSDRYDNTMLAEGHAAFHSLRTAALDCLEFHFQDAMDTMMSKLSGNELLNLAQRTVSTLLKDQEKFSREGRPNLLDQLVYSPICYDDSILPQLEALSRAAWAPSPNARACAECYLELARVVLLHSSIGYPRTNPAVSSGAAFLDERLWEGSLLWGHPIPNWTPKQAPEFTHRSHENIWTSVRSVALFQSLYNAPIPAPEEADSAWKQARSNHAVAEAILFAHRDTLYRDLPRIPSPWWEPIPGEEFSIPPEGSVLYARLLLRHAKLLTAWPPEDPTIPLPGIPEEMQDSQDSICQTLQGNRLMNARKAVETAAGNFAAAQAAALPPFYEHLGGLLCECYLISAELTRLLALLEVEENRLDDAVGLYFIPCRSDLTAAKLKLAALSVRDGDAYNRLRPQWETLCRTCFQSFFQEASPLVQRLRLPENAPAQDAYEAECAAWQREFDHRTLGVSAYTAPHIQLPLDPEALPRNVVLFPAVYSGVYDSVLGNNPGQGDAVENAFFQLVASGKTCILQMNQIVDNYSVLRLLFQPAFRWLCRKGIVTISCFTHPVTKKSFNHPRDFLLDALTSGFRFSSTTAYDRYNCKEPMLRYLENGNANVFPLECREEMVKLGDCYRLLFESFQPSDLRRYHQDAALRYPPYDLGLSNVSLGEAIGNRAALLHQEATAGFGQNPGVTQALVDYQKRWQDLGTRTKYYNAIEEAKAVGEDPRLLDKFKALVDLCYCVSNGWHSCQEVFLTENDPDLILVSSELSGVATELPGIPDAVLTQGRQKSKESSFSWDTFTETAAIVREYRQMDRASSTAQQIQHLERYTGGGYTPFGGGLLLVDYRTTTTSNMTTHFFPAKAGDPDAENFELHI